MAAKGCRCDGSHKHRRRNFVITARNIATSYGKVVPSPYSEIKCLRCRRKWRSKAKYIQKLPDWQERHYRSLGLHTILQLICDGHIKVDYRTGQVFKQRFLNPGGIVRRWLDEWIQLAQVPDNQGKYLFVTIHYEGARRRIAAHRMIWMVLHRRLVPDGYDIDHRDRNPSNNIASNLRLLASTVNQSREYVPF